MPAANCCFLMFFSDQIFTSIFAQAQSACEYLILILSSEPVSRVMYRFHDDDDLSRPYVAAWLKRSTWRQAGQTCSPLFDLAPDRACRAVSVTRDAVVSYTAVSPLPGYTGRSVLCCAFPRVTPGGRYPLSCPVEPGLSSAQPIPAASPSSGSLDPVF